MKKAACSEFISIRQQRVVPGAYQRPALQHDGTTLAWLEKKTFKVRTPLHNINIIVGRNRGWRCWRI